MDRIMRESGPLRHNASATQISFSKVGLVVYGESAVDPPLDVALTPADRADGKTSQPQRHREVPALHTTPYRCFRETSHLNDVRYPHYPSAKQ